MSLRKYTKDDYRRVKDLRDSGMTYVKIAPIVGMSVQICRWIMTRENKLPDKLAPHFKKPGKHRPKREKASVVQEVFKHDPYYC